MFDINIEINFNDSFYNKLNSKSIVHAEEDLIKYFTENLMEGCKQEAPVRSGKLRDGHYVKFDNLTSKVCNDVEYTPYVVYGTSRRAPNNYPQRVMNRMDGQNLNSRFKQSLISNGVNVE